ncbi:MAG TPA: PDZ domain-containing protein [Fimbriimonadaceae bacterium]|nr:PDZ domain-containing protein [Fimbriimonadaceae bacterium]HRJ34208.1 PDZ domain-containing protein [Fimbriimonadaceae bacterium]
MSQAKKFFIPAGIGIALFASLTAGVVLRDRTDKGVLPDPDASRSILASKIDERGDVPAGDYFFDLAELLRDAYVDPVRDEQKLAVGAVRGMVASLADPDSAFFTPDQLKSYRNQLKGTYEGIGVEVILQLTEDQRKIIQDRKRVTDFVQIAPSLVVTAVMPGSPAEQAGLQAGDRVRAIDGKWAVTKETIEEFRALQAQVAEGKLPEAEIDELREQLAQKAKSGITAARAREKMILGRSGEIELAILRKGEPLTIKVNKGVTQVKAVRPAGDAFRLQMIEGAAAELKKLVTNQTELTLDLTQSGEGSLAELRRVFEVLAAPGEIGTLVNERKKPPVSIVVEKGNPQPPALTLVVDDTTRGAAEMLALALSTRGQAKLQGSRMAGDRTYNELKVLPDGSGYLLPVGKFRPALPAAAEVKS